MIKNGKTKPTQEKPKEEKKEEVKTENEKQEIKVIERIIESKEIAPEDAFGKLTRPQIQLIKNTIAKGADDDELRLFIQVCKGAQLNPFLKQVFLVPRWDSNLGRIARAIQVSIDGFRSIAESSGAYAGNDDPVYGDDQEIAYAPKDSKVAKKITVPKTATVTVHKMVEGQRYGFTATSRWSEYYPGPKLGFQWHKRPYLMLGKCAEALALRKAFPKLLSGMYAQEEMDNVGSDSEKAEKYQKGFKTLMDLISKADMKELEDYKQKMEKSVKYTEEQKVEFGFEVQKRINELENK